MKRLAESAPVESTPVESSEPVSAAPTLRYVALEASGGIPIDQTRLSDQQRIGVVLQGAALLSQLEHGGWVLPGGWDDVTLDRDGLLSLESIRPGRSTQPICRLPLGASCATCSTPKAPSPDAARRGARPAT